MNLQLPVLVLLSCSLVIPSLISATSRYKAKEINQWHNSIILECSQSYLQWCMQCLWDFWNPRWENERKRSVSCSLEHVILIGWDFIFRFIQVIAECRGFFSLLIILSPLFSSVVAGKTTGNSLLCAVGYLEHGAVTGGNGYRQIPDSSSWL